MELVGAVDGPRGLEQVQRRALRAPRGLDHGLVLGAVLVGPEQDAVELLADRRRAFAGGQRIGPLLDLRRLLLLALDAQQRRLDGVFRRLLEHALAQAAEVVRRLEQPEQRGSLLVGAGRSLEVLARQVGKTELGLGCEFPGQVQVDLLRQRLCTRDQLGRLRCVEAQQHVGRLHLDPLARVELDLHRAFGLGHQAAGQEFAAVFEQCVHGARLSPLWRCDPRRAGTRCATGHVHGCLIFGAVDERPGLRGLRGTSGVNARIKRLFRLRQAATRQFPAARGPDREAKSRRPAARRPARRSWSAGLVGRTSAR